MRRVTVSMTYQGADITKDIAKALQSFSYEEAAEGSADALTVNLENRDKRWLNDWLPVGGDTIRATLKTTDWNYPGEKIALDCGTMQVDEPTFTGPPDTLSLKALNIPTAAGFNDVTADKTWSSITLRALGAEIAAKYGLAFSYDAPSDTVISSLKKSNQTDADFLKSTAGKYCLCLKVFSNKLILYSKALYEQRPPVLTLTRGASNISAYNISSATVDTAYNAAVVNYKAGSRTLKYEFRIAPGGKAYTATDTADNLDQAKLMAKAKLREINEKQFSGSFTLALDLRLSSACTVGVAGFGKLDGKYFVDSASHRGGGGAGQTEIKVHRCLNGGY